MDTIEVLRELYRLLPQLTEDAKELGKYWDDVYDTISLAVQALAIANTVGAQDVRHTLETIGRILEKGRANKLGEILLHLSTEPPAVAYMALGYLKRVKTLTS